MYDYAFLAFTWVWLDVEIAGLWTEQGLQSLSFYICYNPGSPGLNLQCDHVHSSPKEISWFDMWFNIVKPRFLFKTGDLWSYISSVQPFSKCSIEQRINDRSTVPLNRNLSFSWRRVYDYAFLVFTWVWNNEELAGLQTDQGLLSPCFYTCYYPGSPGLN